VISKPRRSEFRLHTSHDAEGYVRKKKIAEEFAAIWLPERIKNMNPEKPVVRHRDYFLQCSKQGKSG
jgi:hypothetical protein